ncbi:MAG: tRNA (N6-isopentenyl adenosine(37)-C2)-methylthiotransferase MiaB [Chlorobi bacterium]|nr:tRNA (N6-isopentenyl adenosine(37)-C2)-methylthiotransferase MiaB [Chlorobiota bacterium]
MAHKTCYILTLGCQMNKSDSERVQTVLDAMGYSATGDENSADLVGIIACSVRQKAIDKVYTRIYKWNQWKKKKNLVTFLTGCILPADMERFLKLFDLVFTMNDLPEFPRVLSQYGVVTAFSAGQAQNRSAVSIDTVPDITAEVSLPTGDTGVDSRSVMDRFWHIQPTYHSPFEAFVPIQNGCDKFCTFCAVPYTRGREVSRPAGEILEEVACLIENDYKSVTLLGQNVNSYGLDRNGSEMSFAGLLDEIGKLGLKSGKNFRVYFTSPHPRDMKPEVIDVIARYPHLAKQIHLPLQSGDDHILSRMNRNHTVEDYAGIVKYIRDKLPQATLFTDIIVGFAGEKEEHFENTRKAVQRFAFNMAYIAAYSPRPGAVSARWDDDVPVATKKNRLHRLTADLEVTAYKHTQEMVGKTYTVLVTGTDRKAGYLSGMTEGKIVVRFPHNDIGLIGKFTGIYVTSATPFSVEGALVKVPQHEI